ncbi:MAG: pyridoxamine 5'-phosphate oxidase [Flavobacteriales bacterium]|nr:pyridoxamine 5'-phosphate oxidase [Flavobacteriales bacterium]
MKERFDFVKGQLNMQETPEDPSVLLDAWLKNAQAKGISEYQAMVVATSDRKNQVSTRVVYLRDIIADGLVFYTNFNSKKGLDIETNCDVAINLFWKELEQQIRIQGAIKKVNPDVSDAYFRERPRESQIGAWSSDQSKEIPNRDYLEKQLIRYQKEFDGGPVPRPEHWGGYIVVPHYFEFWQGRKSRLHDRICYSKKKDVWTKRRLAP